MRHRQESLELLYRLGWLTPVQLSRLLRPAPKVVPSRPSGGPLPRVVTEPTAWSKSTGWRALEDLRRNGLAHRVRADSPLRRNTENGGAAYAYALTERSGVRAGALAVGELVGSREEMKLARAKYMRSKVDASRVPHRLLGNEWLSMVSAEAPEQGVEVSDIWAEGGSSLLSGSKTLEPDGFLTLLKADGGRPKVYLEADMGTQREAAIRTKVRAYCRYVTDVTDFGRDHRGLARLASVTFVSHTRARSETVLDYIAAELGERKYASTRESLRRLHVHLDGLFLATNLEWALEGGALGESCAAAGAEEVRALLDFPHLIQETY